jgi:cystathionine beta-lyase
MYNFDKVIDRRNTNSVKFDGDKAKENPDLIPMWVADMDFETLPEVAEALTKRASHAIFGYASPTQEYKEAVMGWMKRRHDFEVEKDWFVCTPGVVTAVKLAVLSYTNEGDNVLLHKPVYYPFDSSVKLNGRHVVECPLNYENESYSCDFELFEKVIVDNDVKLFVLCNPHNPIGKVWTKEELYQIGMICKKHGVIVVSDEIHMDFVYEGSKHIPFYNVDESFKDMSIVLTAPSKTFNLAGLIGSYHIIYNEELRKQVDRTSNNTYYNHMNVLSMHALIGAYRGGEEWLDELREVLQGNVDYACDFIWNHFEGVKVSKPQGTYMLYLDCGEWCDLNNTSIQDLLVKGAEVGVIWQDGRPFNRPWAIRMNLALPKSRVEEAFRRLTEYVFV